MTNIQNDTYSEWHIFRITQMRKNTYSKVFWRYWIDIFGIVHLLCGQDQFFATIQFCWITMLSAQVLANLSGRKFCLADISKISCHMNGLTWRKRIMIIVRKSKKFQYFAYKKQGKLIKWCKYIFGKKIIIFMRQFEKYIPSINYNKHKRC